MIAVMLIFEKTIVFVIFVPKHCLLCAQLLVFIVTTQSFHREVLRNSLFVVSKKHRNKELA